MESTFEKKVLICPVSISCQEPFTGIFDFQPSRLRLLWVCREGARYRDLVLFFQENGPPELVVGSLFVWHMLLQIVQEMEKLDLGSDLCRLYFCIQQRSAPFPLTCDTQQFVLILVSCVQLIYKTMSVNIKFDEREYYLSLRCS